MSSLLVDTSLLPASSTYSKHMSPGSVSQKHCGLSTAPGFPLLVASACIWSQELLCCKIYQDEKGTLTLTAASEPSSFNSSNFMTCTRMAAAAQFPLQSRWQSPRGTPRPHNPPPRACVREHGQWLPAWPAAPRAAAALTSAQMKPLSKSVWMTPAPCGALVSFRICQHLTCTHTTQGSSESAGHGTSRHRQQHETTTP